LGDLGAFTRAAGGLLLRTKPPGGDFTAPILRSSSLEVSFTACLLNDDGFFPSWTGRELEQAKHIYRIVNLSELKDHFEDTNNRGKKNWIFSHKNNYHQEENIL
jgi:hypothetical protein